MTDPLDALRVPVTPVDPDPAFARALRARLERALLDPREDPMTTTLDAPRTTARMHALTPYLAVTDAVVAVDFYVAAFGAVRRGEPVLMPDGRTGHAEVALGDSVLMLADEFPEMGLAAPATRGGVSQSLRLEVADPDAVVARALAAGGTLERAVTDSPYGRGGVVLDPSGHRWMVSRDVPAARHGDVVYASLWSPDADRARAFYGAVLGDLGRLGISSGSAAGLFCGYAVDDVDAAVAVVRAAGGTATEPVADHGGRVADCVDDQGLAFALFEGPGAPVTVPEYAELRLPDATRARAFYGTVLGWGFTPGHDRPGYWNGTVDGERTRPRTGLDGGHEVPAVVPTFTVPDLASATAAVRAAGGAADEPTTARFGLVAGCVDDQGSRFLLLQR
ncbi:VOC family protein [Pseudonocardia petroleophila]|uniref:VOC family protein n=1 Tax=Pseudonocardia petroleophila TaxID=37331 RepID=A0A7G7MJI7_9PSEU|nr:VOC family protein [Pseudonocardia petroleophila]